MRTDRQTDGRTYMKLIVDFHSFAKATKTNQLMLYSEIIAVCSQIHTKPQNTLCGQNVEYFSLIPGGIRSNRWATED
jgi:hypothetical protein